MIVVVAALHARDRVVVVQTKRPYFGVERYSTANVPPPREIAGLHIGVVKT